MLNWIKKKLGLFESCCVKTQESNDKLTVFLNDPTTPDLIINLNKPISKSALNFNIPNWKGNNGTRGSLASQCTNSNALISETINYFCKHIRVNSWSATQSLIIVPRAGDQLNAFYDRKHLKFFHTKDSNKKTIYTIDSSDIVTHELGHALLDAIRPELWNMQALEIWSFHEAFADIMAILSLLQFDDSIKYVIEKTNGDLGKPNVVSNLAEQVGSTIYNLTGDTSRSPNALRSAINDFVYVNPNTLPKEAPTNELAAECHSFGRVFLGALYEILVEIYNELVKQTHEPNSALKIARDHLSGCLFVASKKAALSPKYYNSIASSMLLIEKSKGSKYYGLMKSIFMNRKILTPNPLMLSNVTWKDLIMEVGLDDEVIKSSTASAITFKNKRKVTLSDYMVTAQEDNPLHNVEIEVPNDSFYEFNKDGYVINQIQSLEEDIFESIKSCIGYVKNSLGDDSMFKIEDGKLIRNYFE